jgi:hypothetical protein
MTVNEFIERYVGHPNTNGWDISFLKRNLLIQEGCSITDVNTPYDYYVYNVTTADGNRFTVIDSHSPKGSTIKVLEN